MRNKQNRISDIYSATKGFGKHNSSEDTMYKLRRRFRTVRLKFIIPLSSKCDTMDYLCNGEGFAAEYGITIQHSPCREIRKIFRNGAELYKLKLEQ